MTKQSLMGSSAPTQRERRTRRCPDKSAPFAPLAATRSICIFASMLTAFIAPAKADDADIEALNARITAFMADTQIPGLSIAILRPDAPAYIRGFGIRSVEDRSAVTTRTLFKMNSVSKSMTATATARLVDAERLQWDDKIIDHYPEFSVRDPYVTRIATLEDAMSHRVGVEALDWFEDIPHLSLKDAVARMRHLPQAQDFRTRYLYDNYMFSVGGLAASEGEGGWRIMMEEQLFRPLNMKDSLVDFERYIDANEIAPCHECTLETPPKGLNALRRRLDIAAPHVFLNGEMHLAHWRISTSRPAGGVWSSASDMASYMSLYLNDGFAEETPILSRGTIRDLTRPRIGVPPPSHDGQHQDQPLQKRVTQREGGFYALGWRTITYEGRPIWRHEGSSIAYQSALAILPDDGVAIAVMANVSHDREGLVAYLAMDLIDEILDLAPVGWVQHRLQQLQSDASLVSDAVPDVGDVADIDALAPYLGAYQHPAYGPLEIVTAEPPRLVLRQGEHRWGLLKPVRPGVFELTWNGVRPGPHEVYFTPGPDGPAAFLTLRGQRFRHMQ